MASQAETETGAYAYVDLNGSVALGGLPNKLHLQLRRAHRQVIRVPSYAELAIEGEPAEEIDEHRFFFNNAPVRQNKVGTKAEVMQMSGYVNQKKFKNKAWTEECQGVTTDGRYWYISSNNPQKRGVFRFTAEMTDPIFVDLKDLDSDHLGDLDYFEGKLYCAMEKLQRLVILPTSRFDSPNPDYSWTTLTGAEGGPSPQGEKMPWCAIYPQNTLLYSSRFGREGRMVQTVYAYRKMSNLVYAHVPEKDITLDTEVGKIQGGCFTRTSLILSSDLTDDVIVFQLSEAEDGRIKGNLADRQTIRKKSQRGEEVEGVAIWKGFTYDGESSNCHVILLNNDVISKDDIFFKHFELDAAYL